MCEWHDQWRSQARLPIAVSARGEQPTSGPRIAPLGSSLRRRRGRHSHQESRRGRRPSCTRNGATRSSRDLLLRVGDAGGLSSADGRAAGVEESPTWTDELFGTSSALSSRTPSAKPLHLRTRTRARCRSPDERSSGGSPLARRARSEEGTRTRMRSRPSSHRRGHPRRT
jgi:hypothetical protein